ncbi:MAG: hypothetical protein ACTHQQ_16040 [Solirubrobacteraceae bacterium]
MTTRTQARIEAQPVSDSDYVELSRLITEITSRIDHGRASTVHELNVDNGVLNLGLTRP